MSVEITRVLANNPSAMTLTGTNTYVLTSQGRSVVVDGGPADAAHLDAIEAAAGEIVLLLSTHRHHDHTDAVAPLAERTGAPARAFSPQWCRGAEPLQHGETIEFGDTSLRIIATPGHTSDSISVLVPEAGALLTGDTVLGGSTTVIEHPDGTLADFLASLETIAAIGPARILPGHGEEITDPEAEVQRLLQHRRDRVAQVRAVLDRLGAAPSLDPELIDRVRSEIYPDAPAQSAAQLTVAAQLAYLAG